jgi:hypothetical protein
MKTKLQIVLQSTEPNYITYSYKIISCENKSNNGLIFRYIFLLSNSEFLDESTLLR